MTMAFLQYLPFSPINFIISKNYNTKIFNWIVEPMRNMIILKLLNIVFFLLAVVPALLWLIDSIQKQLVLMSKY